MAGRANKRAYRAAVEAAERYASSRPIKMVDPLTALKAVLGQLTERLAFASERVDKLDEDELTVETAFGPVDHPMLRLQRQTQKELAELCFNMARLGLAERMVNIQEARARLIERALVDAALEAGIPRGKLRAIGPIFRRNLIALQGGGEDGPPSTGLKAAA
jgi:hypothetical protein